MITRRRLSFFSCFLLLYRNCLAENTLQDTVVEPPVTTSKPLTTMSSVVETANGSPLYFSQTRTFSSTTEGSYAPPGSKTSRANEHLKSSITQDSTKTVHQEPTETAERYTAHFASNTVSGLLSTQGAQRPFTSGFTNMASVEDHTKLEIPTSSSKSPDSSGSSGATNSLQSPPADEPPGIKPPAVTESPYSSGSSGATDSQQSSPAAGPSGIKPPAVTESPDSSGSPGATDSLQSPPAVGPPGIKPPAVTVPQGPNNSSKTHGPPSGGPIATSGFNEVYNWNPMNDASKTTQNINGQFTTDLRSWIDQPHLFTENFDVVDFIKGICPSTKSCRQGNESSSVAPHGTCCSTCDCSDDCFAKGNCCYDKEMPRYMSGKIRPQSALNESCVFPTFGQASIQQLLNFDKKSVLMISHCTDKKDTLDQSENSCEYFEPNGILSILDLVPVYSSTKLVSYFSHNCAMCNGAFKDLIPWNRTTLSCPSLFLFMHLFKLSTSSETFLHNLKLTGCIIEFHPPHDDSIECLHQESIISDCDESVTNLYNPKIRDYCKNVTIPFGRDGKIYKNIFCFGCNEFKPYIYEFACENYMYGYGYDFGIPEAEIDVKVLEKDLLVDSQNGSEMIPDENCEGGEELAFNQYLNRCLTHVCAPSKVNVSGQCMPVLKNLKNVGLDYMVTYRFVIGTANSEKYFYEEETLKMMTDDNMARICRRNIKTTASLRDYHVTYDILMSRAIMETTNIEKEFHDFKQRHEYFVSRHGEIKSNLDHDGYEFLPLGQIDFVRFNNAEAVNECPETIAMVDLQFCDAVMFRINSDQRDYKGQLLINVLKFAPSEYLVRTHTINDSWLMYAQVCREVFLRKLEELEDVKITSSTIISGSIISSSRTMLLFLCMIFSLIMKTA